MPPPPSNGDLALMVAAPHSDDALIDQVGKMTRIMDSLAADNTNMMKDISRLQNDVAPLKMDVKRLEIERQWWRRWHRKWSPFFRTWRGGGGTHSD